MNRPGGELRRTFTVLAMAVRAFFGFVPFLLNLLVSVVVGGRYRRRIARMMAGASAPVDEPGSGGRRGLVYVIAGEESGDLHASILVRAIRQAAPDVRIRGTGGPRMEEAGCELDVDLVGMSVMGLLPVLRIAGRYVGLMRDLLRMLETERPDVLVPVDYPGFNLIVARAARRRGVRVVYYIAPKIWAWAPWRIRRIARSVDRMLVILPFERELYDSGGVPCAFVGHPLYEHLETVAPAKDRPDDDREPKTVGLLPGSRMGEVRGILPMMLEAAARVREEHPDAEFVLPFHGARLRGEIERIIASDERAPPITVVEGRTHEVMRELDLALVASGTATLELAYYDVPMVVLYRVGRIGSFFKRIVIITPFVGLVNIVAGRSVVPEFVGAEDYSGPSAEVLLEWMRDPASREAVRRDLATVRSRLLFTGVARRAAGFVLAELPRQQPGLSP